MRFPSLARSTPIAAALGVAAVLVLAGCSSDSEVKPELPAYQSGNILSVGVHDVQIRDRIYQVDENGKTYVVAPSSPGNRLAVVLAQVRNDRSTTVIMNVSDESFSLLDSEGKEYEPINPFEKRQLAPNVPQAEPLYRYFLWGDYDLPNTYAVNQWALFEIPAEVKPAQFRWDEVDTVYVRFLRRE